MNGNLFVSTGYKICFSNYIRKPNGLPTKISFPSMVDVVKGRFIIPLTLEAISGLSVGNLEPTIGEFKATNGPTHMSIHTGGLSEFYVEDSKWRGNPVPYIDKSWYCRSNDYALESAATAGCLFYDDPAKIYKEAHKALGMNLYPFYTADMDDFKEPLLRFIEFEKRLIKFAKEHTDFTEKQRLKHKEESKQEYNELFLDIPKLFNLTLHV